MENHRSLWTLIRPLLVLRTADSLDSRWLAQHHRTLVRRHSGSKLTARDRRLRLNPRVLWHALAFRLSRDHRHADEQYECEDADLRNRQRRTQTLFLNCRRLGRDAIQHNRLS